MELTSTSVVIVIGKDVLWDTQRLNAFTAVPPVTRIRNQLQGNRPRSNPGLFLGRAARFEPGNSYKDG